MLARGLAGAKGRGHSRGEQFEADRATSASKRASRWHIAAAFQGIAIAHVFCEPASSKKRNGQGPSAALFRCHSVEPSLLKGSLL
jgi:hypothetical protein